MMATIQPFPMLLFALTLGVSAPAAAQDHSMHAMGHQGMPELKPIPPGSLHTAADVQFMQGMIAHHGQAIHMSKLAETRSRNSTLIRFAKKIDQSQESEIRLMQGWLVDHKQTAPDTAAYHTIMMPGMLTVEELKELATIKGTMFDRRFLELMIQHHEGALSMVDDLFKTKGAAQDIDVNVFANDVHQVQTAEIALMRQMLTTLKGETR